MPKRILFFLFSFALLLISFASFAGQQEELKKNLYHPALDKAKRLEIWKQFNKTFDNKWKVRWNLVTGTPHRISGHTIKLTEKPSKENIKRLTSDLLRSYQDLLQISPDKLTLAKVDCHQGGTWYVYYRQRHSGLPVYGGSVRLVIRQQELTLLGSDYYPGIEIPTEPKVPLQEAVSTIQRDLRPKEALKPLSTELLIYPQAIPEGVRYRLAWKIIMPIIYRSSRIVDSTAYFYGEEQKEVANIPVQWRYFIDALSGQIIDRANILEHEDLSGTVTGQVHPKVPADAPQSRPISHMNVNLTKGGSTYTAVTDINGLYVFTGLSAGAGTLDATLAGPHVVIFNEETGGVATHTSSVTIPTTHSWDWDAFDNSPGDVETNVFYHVNFIHDWFLRGDPFNVLPNPHPMPVTVRDKDYWGNFYCNASASDIGLLFSGLPGSCQDFGLCADIIYHEFTHRIVHKIYDDAGVPLPYSDQTGAMNEGWADYFGCSITDTPQHGTGCYAGRNIDTPDKRYPDNWVGGVHKDGLIFSGSLWDLRAILGSAYVDSLALRAMKNAESGFTDYLSAVLEEDDDPLYSTDPASANNNPSDGTPNIDSICHCYYDHHGIYHDYCASHTETPVALIFSPDPMSFNLFKGAPATVTVIGTALGSSTHSLQNFTLEFAPESAPDTWSSSGMTLTGGGTVTVEDNVLGTWDFTGMSDGFYMIRLMVTDAGSQTATATTSIVIDRQIMDGWPQAPETHFYGTPAVADLDPAFPGNEVIACGYDGKVYAWHKDATAVPGWPVSDHWDTSSPAVGDLDRDGSLEIVVAHYSGWVYVLKSDGTTAAGWPKNSGGYVLATPALGDLDRDGDLEIVVGSKNNQVNVWHHDGTSLIGWPQTVSAEVDSSVAIGDLDNAGQLEVVVGSKDGNVYAWGAGGTLLAGWPQAATDEVSASPALGDLDGDGDLEVVIGSMDHKVYAWHHNGTALPGWPQTATQRMMVPSSASFADLDADGSLEVVVMSNDDLIHVWEADGTPVPGWPPPQTDAHGWEFVVSSPAVGDIDGDGDNEVVAEASYSQVANHFLCKVYAFHHDGSQLMGWPKIVSKYSNSSPALADVDLDGDIEILLGTNGLFIWDLPGAYSTHTLEWPHYRHDIARTGLYGPPSGVVLLFDTSGSMSWHFDGTMGVPPEVQRLTLAKQASYPFLEMLNTYNANKAHFGISVFPPHPWTYTVGCNGQVVTPMTKINNGTKTAAVATTIPGLVAEGNTPLLAGVRTAAGLFGPELNRVIVLLSDGYHNCPYPAGLGDPDVVNLMNRLKADGIRVFTIGFAKPTDVDHPLLEELANSTTPAGYSGSQFYDVTTATFDPATWVPAIALQETYKAILSDALGLQTAVDPRGIISGGTEIAFEVKLNEHDRKASFFLSWVTQKSGRLGLKVFSSDDLEVSARPTTPGVTFSQGLTYAILNVDSTFLKQPGKVGPKPWKIVISSLSMKPGEKENYQYSVILDSGLKMEARLDKKAYYTGDMIRITSRLTEMGKLVMGLSDVSVKISRPGEGLGNWFAQNIVAEADLQKVPEKMGDEVLSKLMRKSIFLTNIRKVQPPAHTGPLTLSLYDDGTHGDKVANDGLYTNQFDGTDKEGTYSFHFHAAGPSRGGNSFEREDIIQEYVQVGVVLQANTLTVTTLRPTEAGQQYLMTITPKDPKKNFLGPRFEKAIKLSVSQGRLVGGIKDNLDGTYAQVLQIPKDADIRKVQMKLGFLGKEYTFVLADQLQKKYSTGIFAGFTLPSGDMNLNYNPGLAFGLMLDYRLPGPISLLAVVGANSFRAASTTVSSTRWWNASVNAKYEFHLAQVKSFLNCGLGAYLPKSGQTRLGANVGAGLGFSIASNWDLELAGNFHRLFDAEESTSFGVIHLGLVHRY